MATVTISMKSWLVIKEIKDFMVSELGEDKRDFHNHHPAVVLARVIKKEEE